MRTSSLAATALLIVLFLGINMFSLSALRGFKLDASEGNIYTLSKGSRNIVASLDEKVRLKLFYSRDLARGEPTLAAYGDRVREILEEFAAASRGKLDLEVIEPLAYSEAEDEASQAGLEAAPLRGANFFLGLVVEGSTDTRVTIPFFNPMKEGFLEYDIAKAILSVGTPDKPVVGLISGIQLQGGFTMDPRTQQPRQAQPWFIMQEVEGLATINNLGTTVSAIPDDVDVLWVVHPKNLSDETLYAIDQFVMKGGHALFCVDPLCEADTPPNPADLSAPRSSNLTKLLSAWGVEVPTDKIAADESVALQVNTQRNANARTPYVIWLRLDGKNVDTKDPITGQMSMLHFASSGFIRKAAPPAPASDATGPAPAASGPVADIIPLVTTTDKAMQLPTAAISTPPDPAALLAAFAPGNEKLTLAARLTGKVNSAFPQGKPATADSPADPAAPSLKESTQPINVILVADTDMMADMFWTQQDRLFNQVMKIADNGDLLSNMIDNLAGNADLISLRARDTAFRPFTRVEEMRREAAKNLLEQQKAVDEEVAQTERELQELQAARGQNASSLVLTPEQQKAVTDLRAKLADSRREQRRLRLELNKDIESLGTTLKLVNIGMMPAAVTLLAVALSVGRRARRKSA